MVRLINSQALTQMEQDIKQICHFPESRPALVPPKYLVKYGHTEYSFFFFFIAFMFLLHEHSFMKINVFLQHHFHGCIIYFANPLI